ncbi:hypothetical protein E7811_06485 [Aliigemmobacter aestuarii]|uniref:Uncharacterized protein n=1 Tax=Aliigemmobacter aestuarii TaxID=1445661 RepID=A0A4S3MT94_9RHOB|nr:hypothetical protein [Gemmobacter aestuarii]THD85343.1 hypothetical protein E7811_06485 [Gemmobacter aestuarii]
MAKKAAPWMWQDPDRRRSVIDVTHGHIDRTHACPVCAGSVGNGAAGLADASRRAKGIDPKRPCGGEIPSRGIRRSIGPDRAVPWSR